MDEKRGRSDDGDRLTPLGGSRQHGHAGQLSAGTEKPAVWRSPVITRIGVDQTLAVRGSIRDGMTGSE